MTQIETLIARVVRQERGAWTVDHRGELRVIEHLKSPIQPVTGDYVELRPTLDGILRVLPRRTVIARRAAGGGEAQVLAANADLALIVMGLDGDYNLRRLERYLVMTGESGARAAVVLNKRDLCADPPSRVAGVKAIAGEAPVVALCALHDDAAFLIGSLANHGETAVMLGSSGAGKSTLANRILGRDLLNTAPVRASDDRGRHTTTSRRLLAMPGGWSLIDIPGLREAGLLPGTASVARVFSAVDELARGCRFRDCTHTVEPGCAVRGEVDAGRLESFRKLTAESRESRERRAKQIAKSLRAMQRMERFSRW